MAAVQSVKAQINLRGQRPVVARPQLPARRPIVAKSQAKDAQATKVEHKALAASMAAAGTMILAESAGAATEISQLAAGDSRVGAIAALFVPALGWVAFNALQPLLNQMDKMDQERKSGIAAAAGLGAAATMFMAESAQASSVYADIAATDSRIGAIAALFVPALGWVAFNALQPLLNQMDKMDQERKSSVAAAAGLGAAATLMFAESANAASEISQVAAGDSRIGAIAALFVPALGWVAFNALQPLLNQMDKMDKERKSGLAAATGLGAAATLMVAESANAATEVSQLAAGDARVGAIAALFVPALGWVAFNALQPLLNQMDKMDQERKSSVAAAAGLGSAATLMIAESANAASEISQLAAGDSRIGAIAALFVPALGWVAFNALQPLLNQMDKMDAERR